MFNRDKENYPLVLYADHNVKIHLLAVGAKTKTSTENNVYALIKVNEREIFMAPHLYSRRPKLEAFYRLHNIRHNIDLQHLEHGTAEDSYTRTMPGFISYADNISESFAVNDDGAVLVNCKNGRSRTSTVVGLYLMKYHSLSAANAIKVVDVILGKKGLRLMREQSGLNGNYADWLVHYEKTKQVLVSPDIKKRKRKSIFEIHPWLKDENPRAFKRHKLELELNKVTPK